MTLLRVTERTRGLDSWWRSSRPGPSAARSTQCEHGLRGTPPARTEGSTAGRAVAPLHGGAPSTWGAIYDLYQYNMAQELGENFEGLKKLQGLVEFLPTKQPYIGFGESAPVDGTHDDNAEEQADRRVEVLFFAQGQEPDIALLDEDPKVSELYHPDAFNRAEVDPMASARRWFAKWETVEVPQEGEEAAPLAASEGKALRLVVRGVGITSDVALSFLVEPVEPPQGQPH